MDNEPTQKADGEKPDATPGAIIAELPDSRPAQNVPAGESANDLAEKHGGRPTGRERKPRADGLAHGSPEAIQKDRDGEAKRKRDARAAKAALLGKRPANPPAIPSALPAQNAPGPLPGDTDYLVDAARAALVLWTGSDIEPVLVELVATLEEFRDLTREKFMSRQGLTDGEQTELMRDAGINDRLKKLFCESAARVLAKLANRSKISADNKDEITCATVALAILTSEFRWRASVKNYVAAKSKP